MPLLHRFPAPVQNLVMDAISISRWPAAAWQEYLRDNISGLTDDPGPQAAIDAGLQWLAAAQDNSASKDGGIARHYHFMRGWGTSYPETTGYSIPTLLEQSRLRNDPALEERARRALDWLLRIQFPSGAFQGSTIGVTPIAPVTFDTGQILIGLAAGAKAYGAPYSAAMIKAADWLAGSQSPDGAWRVANPFLDTLQDAPRTFETHVAWGLLEAARVMPERPWGEAGLKNIRWAIGQQRPNGWFPNCCLYKVKQPLTHTLAYAMRGVLEGYLFSRDKAMFDSAMLTARAMAGVMSRDGFLPGRLDADWKPASKWACLTGTAQTAICWLLLYKETGETSLRNAALKANSYVRRTLDLEGPPETRGGVKGSFPVNGRYLPFQFLNWACKFMIDANTLELALKDNA